MSDTNPEPTAGAAGAAADTGTQLRAAREQRGLSIAKVAETLRVAPNLVGAIEDNRYDAFDAPVYVRGLLRSYGNLVGLSPAALIESYEQQSAGPVAPSLIPPTTAERPRRDFGPLRLVALLIAGVLLVAGSYWWWLTRSPSSDAARPVAAAPSAPATAPSEAAAGATPANAADEGPKALGGEGTPAVAPAGQGTTSAQPVASTSASAPAPTPVISPTPTPAHTPTPTPAAVVKAAASAPAAPAVASTAPRVDTAPAPEDTLVVHGLKECWVEIYAPTGARVLYDLVRNGEARRVPGPGPWRVFLGVASGAKLTVGERPVVVPASRKSGGTARFVVAVDGAVQ
jgi:cytoskeleton protein RodZ